MANENNFCSYKFIFTHFSSNCIFLTPATQKWKKNLKCNSQTRHVSEFIEATLKQEDNLTFCINFVIPSLSIFCFAIATSIKQFQTSKNNCCCSVLFTLAVIFPWIICYGSKLLCPMLYGFFFIPDSASVIVLWSWIATFIWGTYLISKS